MQALVIQSANAQSVVRDSTGWITTLGRDTVVVETAIRTDNRLEGEILVRVPGLVRQHYVVTFGKNGEPEQSTLETTPTNVNGMTETRATFELHGTSPLLTTGFGASFGLYASLGMYESIMSRVAMPVGDTTKVPVLIPGTGKSGTKRFLRRSATLIEVDFFNMAWTHLTVDGTRIVGADAIETTEKTRTTRGRFDDVRRVLGSLSTRDAAVTSVGLASPNETIRASLGGSDIVVSFGSPRLRGREVLGNVVSYDQVWRTGANEATVVSFDHDMLVGGQVVAAGAYSLWTIPTRTGVTLVINRMAGQWGTEYNAKQDLVRIPMTVATSESPRENFAIDVAGSGNKGKLRIMWDRFEWSVPLELRR